MMWPWFNWSFGGFGWIMPIIMIVFWGLVIWGIVFLVRRAGNTGGYSPHQSETALEILKKRYANGDITREEFEEKKRVIT